MRTLSLTVVSLLLLGCGGDDEPGAFMSSTGTGESSSSSEASSADATSAMVDMSSSTTATTTTATTTSTTTTTATTTGGGMCGNGTVDTGEQCDSSNLNGFSCVDLGFAGGTLACDPVTCTYDSSNCTTGGTSG